MSGSASGPTAGLSAALAQAGRDPYDRELTDLIGERPPAARSSRAELEAAGRRFKQDGIDGAGVAAVMSAAGLTNGAFYAHFASKEDLVANVLAEQLRAQREKFRAAPADRAGLESLIRAYLSPEHRDQSADGCPSAALLDEIVRRPAGTKDVFTDEVLATADDIAARLEPKDPDAARTDALTLFGLMVGTLQLSRALTDRDLSDQLLAQGVETALKLIDRGAP